MLRKEMIALIVIIFFSIGGCVSGAAPILIETKELSVQGGLTLEQFAEPWKIIIDNFFTALPDTPDAQLACFQKTIAHGLSLCLNDPFSRYLNQEEAMNLIDEMSGSLTGIGLILSQDKTSIVIEGIMEQSPAQGSGMLSIGDEIIEVDGRDVSKEFLVEVVKRIRGHVGTQIIIRVRRNGVLLAPVTLVRQEIFIPSVYARDIDDHIVYVQVRDFNVHTPAEFFITIIRRLIVTPLFGEKYLNPYARKFIFDLRGNPGGLVDSVAWMSYFFSQDPNQIILTRKLRSRQEIFRISDIIPHARIEPGIFKDVRAVILIDQGSASAAEIFAAFVHEAVGASRVGKRSFGKGTIQEIFPLSHGDMVLLTIAEYFVGNSQTQIHHIGIQPEYEVERSMQHHDDGSKIILDPAEDLQLKKAIEVLRN